MQERLAMRPGDTRPPRVKIEDGYAIELECVISERS